MKIILDLDTGIDDAIALAYLAGRKDIDLIGVTAVFGNVEMWQSAFNSRSLLNLFNRKDVPVFEGSTEQINGDHYVVSDITKKIHGTDGLADLKTDWKVKSKEGIYDNAVDFMINSAEKYGDDLTIITTTPLTNLAHAYLKAPETMKKVHEVICMAGALLYNGNRNKLTEANVGSDPEAAKIVFESEMKTVMIGLDVTYKVPMVRKLTDEWRINFTGNLLADATNYYYDFELDHVPANNPLKLKGGCMIHDATAVIYYFHPEWFTTIDIPLTVLTDLGRGRTVGRLGNINDEKIYSKAAINADGDKILQHLQLSLLEFLKECK